MKLFFDTSPMLNYPCGIAVYIKQLLNCFVEYDDLEIHTGMKCLSRATHTQLKTVLSEQIRAKIAYHPLYLPGKQPLTFLQKCFSAISCDVAHFSANFMPPYLPHYDLSKAIITVHDMYFWHPEIRVPVTPLEHFFMEQLPLQAAKCRAIVTVSQFSKEQIVKFLNVPPEKIHVIPNATQWTSPAPETCDILSRTGITAKDYFLSVSTLDKHKNFINLCDAFRSYRQSRGCAGEKLVIVGGRRPGDDEIRSVINSTADVIHLPRVTEAELRYLYANAKGFFLLSKMEGFGIPLLEAMESKIPACYGKGNAMDEIGRDAAVGIDPDDIDAVAEVFRYFSAAPEELQKRVETAYRIAGEYSWKRSAEQLYRLYKSVKQEKEYNDE